MLKDKDNERHLTAKQCDNNSPVISGDLQEKMSDNTSNSGTKEYEKGEHPNFTKHRFQKGVSGNPKGRPVKDKEFREALKSYGSVEPELWDNANSNFDDVIKSLWKKARSGDLQTIKYLVDLGVMNQSEKPK